MSKSSVVFYSCLGFIIGIGLASFFYFPEVFVYLLVISGILVVIFSSKKTLVKTIGWCMIFLILGICRYQLSIPQVNQKQISYYNNSNEIEFKNRQTIIFRGIVADEPDIRKDQIKLTVESKKFQPKADPCLPDRQAPLAEKVQDKWKEIHGKVLVKAGLFPEYQYGDLLEIKCALSQPAQIEDFAYDKYLAKSDIYSACYQGQLKLLKQNQGNFFKSKILLLKDKIIKVVGQLLPEPQSSFLGGLLWGAKKGMPEDILQNFNRTGVTHIIAVSGYNITIIAVMLANLFIHLGASRKKSFWLIITGIIFFVIITGAPASIIRAAIMGIISLSAAFIGRLAKIRNTLALVAFIMLLINPKILIWDAGFQLSFLATLGLVYFAPILEKYNQWLPEFLGVRESLTTTMSAIVLTTPLILFQFNRLSLVAPLANLLILPLIPINMAIGFFVVIVGLVYLPLGIILAWSSWLALTTVLEIVDFLANLNFASIEILNFSVFFILISYLLIFYCIIKFNQHEKSY
jgi:competence protein ComEC